MDMKSTCIPLRSNGGGRKYNIENSTSLHDSSVDLNDFMKHELKYVAFKYLPYGLKQFAKVETIDFGVCQITNSKSAKYSWGNIKNYERFTENSVLDKQGQNYFQFVHCEGAHDPVKNMDKYLNTIENGSYEQKIAASLTLIKAYLQRLKDNDVYDNSVIVIMSDHEYAGPGTPYDPLLDRFNPILFVKGINEKHDMLVSDRSVSYADLQDAFSDLIEGKQSTELFADLEPGRTRTVIWQNVKKEGHKVEYELTGKAWETDKLIPTGNVYDLE